jgi:ParB family transcriptional regulator, chromosome partitioning protein
LNVVQKSIDELIPYAKNARTHSEAQVAQIAASIREFGWMNPVLIDAENNIIAGHCRVLAARKLGLGEVPCVLHDHLTETQRKAYILADNKMALNAGWDEGLLRLELRELGDMGFDLELIGFGLDEVGMTDPSIDEMPNLPDGDKEPFQQKTFTLHDDQAAIVDDALTLARTDPTADTGINENSNGNALSLICKQWLAQKTSS